MTYGAKEEEEEGIFGTNYGWKESEGTLRAPIGFKNYYFTDLIPGQVQEIWEWEIPIGFLKVEFEQL